MSTGSALLAFIETLGMTYGSRRTYPPKCMFCTARDTFRIDREKQKASCYKHDDVLAQCPRYKKEDKDV